MTSQTTPTIQTVIDDLNTALADAQAVANPGSGTGSATVPPAFVTLVEAFADAPNNNDAAEWQAIQDYLSANP